MSSVGFIIPGGEISATFLVFPIMGDVVFALLAFLYLKKKKLLPIFHNHLKIPVKDYFIPFIAIILYSILGNLILYSLSDSMKLMEYPMQANPFLYCMAVYLVAPVTEELIFWGFIQTRIRTTINVIPAILTPSENCPKMRSNPSAFTRCSRLSGQKDRILFSHVAFDNRCVST